MHELTDKLIDKLQKELPDTFVTSAMRYTSPFAQTAVARIKEKTGMDFEFVNRQTTDFSGLTNNSSFFRLIPGYKLGDHFSLVAGPSVGFTVFDKNWTYPSPGYVLAERATSNGKYTLHAGFYAGVQYEF